MNAALESLAANLRRLCCTEEVTFESPLGVEALENRVRESMVHVWGMQGLTGRVGEGRAKLGWSFTPVRYPNCAAFKASIEPTANGSRITGSMEVSLINQCMATVWLGLVLVISLMFVWTIIIPLGGFCLLWLGAWIFTLGDAKTEQNIRACLAGICEVSSPPSPTITQATS